MSAGSAVDKKKCEIVVDKVERKDLGQWRSKLKNHILTEIQFQLSHGFVICILTTLQCCVDIIHRLTP